MIKTLKDALKYGMEIRREVRFYAIAEDGTQYWLVNDWTTQVIDQELLRKENQNGRD